METLEAKSTIDLVGDRMLFKPRFFLTIGLAILFSLVQPAAHGQGGGGTLQGTVFDPNGAAVPDAKINITSVLTGVSRDVASNANGFYSAPNLSAGTYKVTTSAPGFSARVDNDVLLTVG